MAGIYRRSTLSAAPPLPNLHPPFINPAPTTSSKEASAGAPTSSSSSSPTTRSKHAASIAPRVTASSSSSSPLISANAARRSSRSRVSSREQRDLSGRWLADDLCSNCGGPTQESRLYCSEECLRQESEASHKRESNQIAQAMAEAQFVQASDAFQAMADVDIADDHFDFTQHKHQHQKHRHSFPLPFAQPLPTIAPGGLQQSSPTESVPPLSSISQAARSEMIRALLRDEFKHLDEVEAMAFLRKLAAFPYSPRPPASDASSSSLASLPQPGTNRQYTPNFPAAAAHDPRAPLSYRSSSASSVSSGQQRNSSSSGIFAHPHRSRSRSSTMSETTSTSDDAYTTGPGTPSPAIQPNGGIIATGASHGYPGVIHEDDSEPTLLSLPPSISSPSAVLLSGKSSGKGTTSPGSGLLSHSRGNGHEDTDQRAAQYAAAAAAAAMNGANYASTYNAHRSPVMSPLQYQQAVAAAAAARGRNGSKSNPGTPWRGSVALPDPMRRSPGLMPVLSPPVQGMRFARRPSSTAMPRSAVSAAIAAAGITTSAGAASSSGMYSSAVLVHTDSQGHHPLSAVSSPVLTPTSGGTASTTPTASVGHVAGLTSSSMPHAMSFYRPRLGTTSPAVGPTTRAQQQQQQQGGSGMAPMVRRTTRERVGIMTPALPPSTGLTLPGGLNAKWPTTVSVGGAATSASSTTAITNTSKVVSGVRPGTRSRSHTTTATPSACVPAFASDSASDFARSTSEEEEEAPSDLELECRRGCRCHSTQAHQHRRQESEVRGRSQVSVASPATGSGSGTAGSRCSPATARSSVTARATATGRPTTAPAASDLARGRSRAQGERSSSRRGRSPPRGAARTESSLTRLSAAAAASSGRTGSIVAAQRGSDVRRVSPEVDRRGRSPTVPRLVSAAATISSSSISSPKLSPCTAAPQARADSSPTSILHPHHALFGVDAAREEDGGGVEMFKRGTSSSRRNGRGSESSSWERASPLAKLARWQDEAEARRGRAEDVKGEDEERQGRGRGRTSAASASREWSGSRTRGRRDRGSGGEGVVQPMSRAVRSDEGASRGEAVVGVGGSAGAVKAGAGPPASALALRSPARAAVDPGFDDVEFDIEL
ncbi:hypothetical protein A4X13_0g6481 [Tilletia indica]|uniref:Uncharacterized protein n=1 Tax=Tilletia indica TaxID=43049 RepID=A0A177TF96_9BASI|nr:hypothetical protein A4X13_0g6481 [Tilletia indica]